MVVEYFLLRKIERMVRENNNYYALPPNYNQLDEVARLRVLTRHHNGYIRQHAVLCLGSMGEITALPELVERANDWVEQVRKSARRGIRQLLTSENSGEFLAYLPDIFGLLNCQRDNHQLLIDEVLTVLAKPDNQPHLFSGVSSDNKFVARLSLRVLVEQQIAPMSAIFRQAMQHADPLVRVAAMQYQMQESTVINQEILDVLLNDPFAVIKQAGLQYVMDNNVTLSEPQLVGLLFDKNWLVRKRAAGLLLKRNSDPVALYCDVLNTPQTRVSIRKVALIGLDEQRYEGVVARAQENLLSEFPSLYFTALNIILRNAGEDAHDVLFAAISHPSLAIAKRAITLFHQQKAYLRLPELQSCMENAASKDHIALYYSFAHELNKWDWLIFILCNIARGKVDTKEQMTRWTTAFSRSWVRPNSLQKERLIALIDAHPDAINKDEAYIRPFVFT